ncbi:hypothetical protein Bca4012_064157 [Brassica carinata]
MGTTDPWKNFGPHDLDQQQQETGSFMNLLTSGDHVSSITDQYFLSTASSSTLNHQSKFSVFLFNHETATFTQLPNSASSSFDQGGTMDSLTSSSSMTKKNTKLSIRNKTRFKNTNLLLREKTILKKALELSVLCDNEICVIHYDREGNLVNTYPEDQRQVKDILERYNSLSDGEKLKKNTNLSQFFNKKLVNEKRRALTDADEHTKFTQKVGEFKGSMEDKLQMLKDMVH